MVLSIMTQRRMPLLLVLACYCVCWGTHNSHAFSPVAFVPQRNAHYLSLLSTASSSSEAVSSSANNNVVNEEDYDLSLFSPCKINLFLRIIRKREDGFHDLASLFQTVGFGDMLHLKLLGADETTSDEFDCNMEGVPTDQSNLVLRALTLLREKTGLSNQFFRANLVKCVPAQAGLGGGSGNAAAALYGANELLGRPATQEQLVEWSGALGSDITFFLSRGTAYCTGRGEIMSLVEPPLPAGTKLCIVKPQLGLSTPQVFGAMDYDKLSDADPQELLQQFTSSNGPEGSSMTSVADVPDSCYVNDLEFPAFQCVPELKELKEQLLKVEGFQHVLMSGSGTSIFCMGEPTDKDAFQKEFGSRDDLLVVFTEFINRGPGDGVWFEEPSSN
uniref:4-(cytidine 5'-diphospho)-2-C-methyl-D-erythritol kinase n=1 Tax=Attheya septentrionalis TaxID=420275 RepID=A0A7S2URY2_9STRA|mmetsp:Transcript_6996/g.12556  ORF Transcript_6996/g.12556 Transcript_6996/m.12556 type:complete len:388 (+) Transcript_6996:151-1314(+)